MPYDYIKRVYGVDPKFGQRITHRGKSGVIIRPTGDPHYLRVRFDGRKHADNVHPTDEVDYSPSPKGASRMWREVTDETPCGESLIVWGPGWINAGEAVRSEDDGVFYSPNSGCNVEPQPTMWMPMPDPPVVTT